MNKELSLELQHDIENIANNNSIRSILNVICKTTGMGFSAVARVTDSKWITCLSQDEINFGLLSGDELSLKTTICDEIRQHQNPVIIEEVAKSSRYRDHHTPLQYGFQSYISFPIFRKDGRFFGTLCAIDPAPAKLETEQIKELFTLYTELITFHLDKIDEMEELSSILLEEIRIAELRETFIAVLGHDLRNPVGITRRCADVLLTTELSAFAKTQVSMIKSTSYQMQALIDNLLDFAKGHLGDGIQLKLRDNNRELKKTLIQVSREFESIHEGYKIKLSIILDKDVVCDIDRISQLFSNLIGNAIQHGTQQQPIEIEIKTELNKFSLKVSNGGKKIPIQIQTNLFKPYFTTNSGANKSGLGLGLYICSEIAKAHGGNITVQSTDQQTSFEFTMPI